MACRKMTFSIPEDVATQLVKRVPSRDRSRYVAEAIARQLQERERRLIHACEVANQDADIQLIEDSWDALADGVDQIEEPWKFAPPR